MDHPRSRGVYRAAMVSSSASSGSSPLARGLLRPVPTLIAPGGIIPARAGFTPVDNPGDFGYEDHPRSRGVYWRRLVRANFIAGSSPLARGLLEPHVGEPQGQRIIPARAGFTGRDVRQGP